jgi:hypothetical protein
MPFSYYARLSRTQQAIYRRSDAIAEIVLPRPDEVRALVTTLEAALKTEDREATQRATERLVHGLGEALGLPPVRVEVLAARPHARWGELHGLYTSPPRGRPKIQLWMRTAKQKRVVAFRTFLRTVLHEVGHHIDYTKLRLSDSFHTEGFYKRESSLFHQLVDERRGTMATWEEYATWPREQRFRRLARAAEDFAAAIAGRSEAALARRPDPKNWAPKEIVCHVRDTEEGFVLRFRALLAMDEPTLVLGDPDRWAVERQYLRNDVGEALEAFRARRRESLAFLATLAPEQWARAAVHPARGRLTADDYVSLMAWHDDNHLDQLARALEGRA